MISEKEMGRYNNYYREEGGRKDGVKERRSVLSLQNCKCRIVS